MSNFYLPSASVSASSTPAKSLSPRRYGDVDDYELGTQEEDDDDLDTLPYPAELARNDFLAPNFDAQTYLSSLRNRHQTLEDLRSDLRQRSQLLNKELLDLVHNRYDEFLSLGGDLKSGEEKIESVRVGVLGFEREVDSIKRTLSTRLHELGQLVDEKKNIRQDIVLGRRLLEIDNRIEELEGALGLRISADADDDFDSEDEDDEDADAALKSHSLSRRVQRLKRNTERFMVILHLVKLAGKEHPFLQNQLPRLNALRKTLHLDLATALKHAKQAKDSNEILELVSLYGDIDAQTEGIQALKAA